MKKKKLDINKFQKQYGEEVREYLILAIIFSFMIGLFLSIASAKIFFEAIIDSNMLNALFYPIFFLISIGLIAISFRIFYVLIKYVSVEVN